MYRLNKNVKKNKIGEEKKTQKNPKSIYIIKIREATYGWKWNKFYG